MAAESEGQIIPGSEYGNGSDGDQGKLGMNMLSLTLLLTFFSKKLKNICGGQIRILPLLMDRTNPSKLFNPPVQLTSSSRRQLENICSAHNVFDADVILSSLIKRT